MSRLSDAEIQAEQLNRGPEDVYYGEEWPSREEIIQDATEQDEEGDGC